MSADRPRLPSHFAIRSGFDDFETFREVMSVWDLDFWQLDRGSFAAQLVHVVTPTVILSRSTFSRKLDQNGAPPAGFRTFGIPADDAVRVRWRGADYHGDSVMLFPRGGELNCHNAADRVHLTGQAVTFLIGKITLEELVEQS